MRKTCGGEKWGRFSRACLECERRGGYQTPESVFCLLWGSSRRNVERPGVQSGDEQGAGPGWKVGRRQLRTHRHPDLDHQGAARGGQWGGTGGGSGWKVGTREQHGEDGGKQPSLPRWLSTHSPGWKVGTIRERPGVESGGAQGLSAHSWAQRSRPGTVLTRPGTALAHKSDTTPAQHAKTRLRPGVTSTIHDTVFDLWTTQAQGRTQ